MKLSCTQDNLNKGLGIVGRAVPGRTTLPITNNVLIATDESRLKLVATNLEIAISCWLGARVEEEGAITVPARLLTEFVGSLPNEKIEMSVAPQGKAVQLRCARFDAKISALSADEFPPIPSVAGGVAVQLKAEVLRQAINQVAFAAAVEEARPVLTGVHADFDGDRLTLAAADGFRLAVQTTALGTPVAEKTGIIVPARAMTELSRLLAEQEEPVEITVNAARSQALFRLKNVEMVSQLIQGTFPNYTQLIPQGYATRAVVSVTDFLRATRSASIFARDGSGIVRIYVTPGSELKPGKIAVSASAEELGDNVAEIDAVVEGEEAKIAFNSRYLSDVLNVLHDGQVALETTSPSSPGVIRPVGVTNYVHVIMPMFVQW